MTLLKHIIKSAEEASLPTTDGSTIIAAGPLVKQPGSVPYRIVLIAKIGEFVVTTETFHNGERTGFGNGNYFHFGMGASDETVAESLRKATMRFCERLSIDAENYYGSLPRSEVLHNAG